MPTLPIVTLQPATTADRPTLARLLADYLRELHHDQRQPGVPTYQYLPTYFTDPDRSAWFIMADGDIAGFVLINTHTLVEPQPQSRSRSRSGGQPQAHAIAEIYVLPAYRRRGIGERAAVLAFAQFPGRWEVAQLHTNQPAIRFWRRVIGAITHGEYQETLLDTADWHGPVQTFTVGPSLGLARGAVELRPHQAAWAQAFVAEKTQLQAVLPGRPIEHVGSTAIAGLVAKPIIDIAVAINSLAEADMLIQPLAALGYQDKGEAGVPGRRFFVKGSAHQRTVYLHLGLPDGEFGSLVAFRNALRQDPQLVAEYNSLKQSLAATFADDRQAYTRGKAAFIRNALAGSIGYN